MSYSLQLKLMLRVASYLIITIGNDYVPLDTKSEGTVKDENSYVAFFSNGNVHLFKQKCPAAQ